MKNIYGINYTFLIDQFQNVSLIYFCRFRGVAQLGRALGSGPRGRMFKSCYPDHNRLLLIKNKNGIREKFFAQMAELVDALGSGLSEGNFVEVRVLFWAPFL